MSNKPKLAVFFGAGAEIGYGLPSGGKFAIDIFKMSPDEDKALFREQLNAIDPKSQYASKWLPDGYSNKRVFVFGKGDFEGLIASSLEYRKNNILHYFENFDASMPKLLKSIGTDEDSIREKYLEFTKKEFGSVSYSQVVKINKRLSGRVTLFDSEYFSAFLKVLELSPSNRMLNRIVRSFLELLIGAFGQSLVSDLNEELFEQAPDELSVFDDLTSIFTLDYKNAGQTGIEILLEETIESVKEDSDICEVIIELGKAALEDIFSSSLDYQALIDNHFRYLYNPKIQWAKFTRISIFLHTVRRYIKEGIPVNSTLESGPGYYHDLLDASKYFEIEAIGTTNYNNFIKQVIGERLSTPIYHLNGSVNEYYDPYRNMIYEDIDNLNSEDLHRLLVPLMFTQSGIKPLTSISMSRRYVDLYDQFKKADIICSIGYGYNGDDGHINGLLRALVEEDKKQLVIFEYNCTNINKAVREYQAKLRLNTTENLKVVPVNNDRQTNDGLWYDTLNSLIIEELGKVRATD